MSAFIGKSPLETLKNFRARGWFDKEFVKFATRVATEYQGRNEVKKACVISHNSSDADEINLVVSAGELTLDGALMQIGTITNKESIKPANASIEITIGSSLPSYAGNSGEFEIVTITSNSKTFKLRLFDSDNAGGFDTASDASHQIDVSKSGVNRDTMAEDLIVGLKTVFLEADGYSYSAVSNGVFTVTAPVGSNFNFVYAETGAVTDLAGAVTDYASSFGGFITSTGSAQVTALNSAATDYRITYIASNSDGVGGSNTSDNSTALVHAILSSSATTHLSSKEINAALAGSAGNVGNYDHSGATGWVHLAQVAFESSAAAVTLNRNNAVSRA